MSQTLTVEESRALLSAWNSQLWWGSQAASSWEMAFLPHPRTFITEQPRISTQRALLICCMVHDILSGLVSFGWQNKICQWCSETWQATRELSDGKRWGYSTNIRQFMVCVFLVPGRCSVKDSWWPLLPSCPWGAVAQGKIASPWGFAHSFNYLFNSVLVRLKTKPNNKETINIVA